MVDFSKRGISKSLVKQIQDSLKRIKGGYGSVEIILQNHCVTQISTREITKTNQPIVTTDLEKRVETFS